MTPFIARREWFASVGSTNDVARAWLDAGTPEICLVVAGEQTAGRGREGRRWLAPPGTALLLSLAFRPTWLAPDRVWRLAAIASLALADAAEAEAGLPLGTIRLKWPNDLVIPFGVPGDGPAAVRKVAGILGETEGLGTRDPRAVIGLGINVDWAAADFPADLASSMTSLREAPGGRRVELDALLDTFLVRLESRVDALRQGDFDGVGWAERQLTSGRTIRLVAPGGDATLRAIGVDPGTGALIVADAATAGGERHVLVGEITHVRLAEPIAEGV